MLTRLCKRQAPAHALRPPFTAVPTVISPVVGRRPRLAARQLRLSAMAKSSDTKKPRLESPLMITHSGTFHADEALAVSMLRTLPQYKGARLVRTRDPSVIETGDIVVDVGGEYDPERNRYDHHQRGFEETYSADHKTKLSSAGLIYKHFAADIIAAHLGVLPINPQVLTLVRVLYDSWIEAIDGIDNGIAQYEAVNADGAASGEVRARYRNGTDLSSRVAHLNPAWNEPTSSDVQDAKFEEASKLAGSEFFARVDYYARSWLPARAIVVDALDRRKTNDVGDSKGRVLVFDQFCPWKEHLHSLEEQGSPSFALDELPLYVLYPDDSGSWRIQAIPVSPSSFESRKPLPEPWRGVRDNALSELTGIPGCIFAHASGFIGGNKTKAGATAMAKKALEA